MLTLSITELLKTGVCAPLSIGMAEHDAVMQIGIVLENDDEEGPFLQIWADSEGKLRALCLGIGLYPPDKVFFSENLCLDIEDLTFGMSPMVKQLHAKGLDFEFDGNEDFQSASFGLKLYHDYTFPLGVSLSFNWAGVGSYYLLFGQYNESLKEVFFQTEPRGDT